MNVEQFTSQLAEDGISLSAEQVDQFASYYQLLVEWNQKMNLTAITEEGEVYLKHFYDSLSAATFFDFNQPLSIVDVGAGAGFPSIPLKICFPHLKITIVDSLRKRITFLSELTQQLGLREVRLFHQRAETFAREKEHREQYDLAMARAVARLNVLAELCIPLVKREGFFLALKGAKGAEELAEAKKAIQLLGGKLERTQSLELPFHAGERWFILIRKVKDTPKKYPRQPGIPNKQPLS